MFLRRRISLVRSERGFALVMALGMMIVLSAAVVTAITYSTSNTTETTQSGNRNNAFTLAEAGINNAMAVLNLPANNALDPDVLPNRTSCSTNLTAICSAPYGNGYVVWGGTLDRAQAVWTVTSTGYYRNPGRGNAGYLKRTLTARVTVVPNYKQPLNNPVWNYLMATGTGNTCDETLNNNVSGAARFYVAGNLCLNNNVVLTQNAVIVRGAIALANGAAVGASTSMSTRVETYVGNGCKYGTATTSFDVPCPGDPDHVYSKKNGPSYVAGVNTAPPLFAVPATDYPSWYENAIPGPSQSCTTSSGTPPTFDTNYPNRDNNVVVQDLTPSTSYTCRVGQGASTTLAGALTSSATTISVASATGFPTTAFRIRIDDEYMNVTGGFGTTTWTVQRGQNGSTAAAHVASQTVNWDTTPSGEISWNATTKTLTILGTIFIDGSAKIANSATNKYIGQATLYLSGTFYLDGKMCGGISAGNCDFSAWDPNTSMLTIVTNSTGGQVTAGDGVLLNNNASYQGSLYSTGAVEYGNNAFSDGPVVGSSIILANNVTTQAFPNITTLPAGQPGNPEVYAQPNPPQMFSG
jgi:Tfp pilus assembly protein PilX